VSLMSPDWQWAQQEIIGNPGGGYLFPSVIRVPISRWQALKERWLPWWIRRVWPVKYDVVYPRDALIRFLEERGEFVVKQ